MIEVLNRTKLLALRLTGCQSENEMLMDDVSDIKEIYISGSIDFGEINEGFFATFEDSKV